MSKPNQLQKNNIQWKNVRIKDVAFVNKNSLGNDTPNDFKFKYIDLSSVNNRQVEFPTEYIKYNEAPSRARRIAQKGDIIMATVRPNLLGYCMVDFDTNEYIYSTGFAVIENKKDLLNNYFLFSYLFSKKFQDDISNMLVGSSYPAINSSDVLNLKFDLPPLPEQNRIVSVLETWDKNIKNLNKKIEIKKNIKKGLMQDLLTGKKRLSGFKDKWEELKIKDIGEIVTGNTPSKRIAEYYGDKYLWATAFDFNGVYIDNTEIKLSELGKSVSRVVPIGSILITCIASIGKNAIAQKPMSFNQQINAIIPNKKHNSEFIYYLIENSAHKLKEVAGGGALAMISKGVFEKIKLIFPKLEEQNAIANILTTADKEITELEKKLEVINEQKKYLLNNLITGAIRTPENLSVKS